ncbi:MAG: sigma 54-interacting transcriptional regulator [Ndongobacter sp.]|nr:sigma 54-interacting transcriptional regulator [Ndongobacter sp.]
MKSIAIISISHAVGLSYEKSLHAIYGSEIETVLYSVDGTGIAHIGSHDLYLISTTSSDVHNEVLSKIDDVSKIVIVQLTFLKKDIERLRNLAPTSALFINLSEKMARESISDLYYLGVNNIHFIPYYPGAPDTDESFAITSGEARYAPPSVTKLIDMGNRCLSANTITEITLKLGLRFIFSKPAYARYIESLAEQDYSLNALRNETLRMENRFEVLVEHVNFGLVGVDANHRITIFNPLAEKYTGYLKSQVLFDDVTKCIREFSTIDFLENDPDRSHYLIKFFNEQYSVSVTPITMSGEYVGHYIMLQKFMELEKSQADIRKQLVQKTGSAKYTFSDIISCCEKMSRAKHIAKKMAQTDLSVLLYGESGTGKELFAHSIHNASQRADNAFVAINCAAIPDNLLESELFGYVEGAFTGAAKGGKLGLFEQAHKGTIFLDEIEAMSPNLQIKLLRVLEEKEIMRVGDVKTVAIDVRVICASNEDIRQKVRSGIFRKDLYYRLNTLPIEIPPLRERPDDIPLLIGAIKRQIHADFELSGECEQLFLRYPWEGNVRELKNILEYLKFMELDVVHPSDLPSEMLEDAAAEFPASGLLTPKEKQVLRILSSSPAGIGRKAIRQALDEIGLSVSEGEVRSILKALTQKELIQSRVGRGGTRINPARAQEVRFLIG